MKTTHAMCARFSVLLFILLFSSTIYAGSPKVEVCHVPPGNPDNFHTIKISENALGAHLAHGDLAGACSAACADLCDDGNACTVDDFGDCETNGCPVASIPVDCSDGNLCTDDICDPSSGCANPVAVTCEAPDLCSVSTCDPLMGVCEDTPLTCDEGESCNPSNGICEEDGTEPEPNICPCFGGVTTEDKLDNLALNGSIAACGSFDGFPGLVGAIYDNGAIACSGPLCTDFDEVVPSCGGPAFGSVTGLSAEENAACQAIVSDSCTSSGNSGSSQSPSAPTVKNIPFLSD